MPNSVMDRQGRVWVPQDVLRAAGIDEPVEMTVEFDAASGIFVLRPGEPVPEEDWDCYLPEAREAYERAANAPGRYQLNRADLERLGREPWFIEEIRANPKYRAEEEPATAAAGA